MSFRRKENKGVVVAGILFFLSLAGCRSHIDGQNQPVPPDETQKDLVITLGRGACFGVCPIYKLTITADGSVTFDGIEFVKKGRELVKKTGISKTKISQEQLKQLVAEFEKINYFNLKDRYSELEDGCTGVVTDAPSVNTSITIRGKTKSVQHYHGCMGLPILEALTKLEDKIDEIVNTSQWLDKTNR